MLTSDPWWSAVRWVSSLMGSCLLSAFAWLIKYFFLTQAMAFPLLLKTLCAVPLVSQNKGLQWSRFMLFCNMWRIAGWYGNTPVTAEEKCNRGSCIRNLSQLIKLCFWFPLLSSCASAAGWKAEWHFSSSKTLGNPFCPTSWHAGWLLCVGSSFCFLPSASSFCVSLPAQPFSCWVV